MAKKIRMPTAVPPPRKSFLYELSMVILYPLHLLVSRERSVKKRKNAMNRTKKDRSDKASIPLLKDSRCSRIDNCLRTAPTFSPERVELQLNTQNRSADPKETAAAIIWFSVSEDMKIPRAIKAAPMSRRPK